MRPSNEYAESGAALSVEADPEFDDPLCVLLDGWVILFIVELKSSVVFFTCCKNS